MKHKEKPTNKMKRVSVSQLYNNFTQPDTHLSGVPKAEEREKKKNYLKI